MLFQWDDANLPNTMSARATLTAGVAYNLTLTVSGGKGAPRVFVLSPARPANVLRSELASELDYYFIDGGEQGVDGAVAGYRQATGAATLPPKAVLGFTQCKERYHNQSELLQSAHTFRRLEIPVDFIVQDWHYWGPDCNWAPDWNPGQYPDPKGMVAELHSMNYTFMVSVWSKFGDCSAAYKIMSDKGFLINGTPYYDPYNSAAREQFYQLAKAAMFDIGVDALWLDATEPEGLVNINHSVALGSGNYFLNPYALETTRAISEGVVRDYSMRVFSLTRSSFAGMHRNGAVLWSGDISGTWAMLQRQVAASINYALSGEPYWACDTGGFFRPANQYTDPGCESPSPPTHGLPSLACIPLASLILFSYPPPIFLRTRFSPRSRAAHPLVPVFAVHAALPRARRGVQHRAVELRQRHHGHDCARAPSPLPLAAVSVLAGAHGDARELHHPARAGL